LLIVLGHFHGRVQGGRVVRAIIQEIPSKIKGRELKRAERGCNLETGGRHRGGPCKNPTPAIRKLNRSQCDISPKLLKRLSALI